MDFQENNCDVTGINVSIKDFASLVRVDESAVYHAIRKGRLGKAVIRVGSKKRILVYEGCVTWFIKKNASKDRTKQDDEDIEASRKRKEFFQSLIVKLEYQIKSGQLVSIQEAGKIGSEVCLAARRRLEETRDQDCYKLMEINNDNEARCFLKARDDAFLKELANLPEMIERLRKLIKAEDEEAVQ